MSLYKLSFADPLYVSNTYYLFTHNSALIKNYDMKVFPSSLAQSVVDERE
jgi:hypothetical protein